MAKVFVAFLGTGDYVKCPYCYGNLKSSEVTYVQTAMLELFCKDWNWDAGDRFLLGVTEGARKQHYESLCCELDKMGLPKPQVISLPDGSRESEMWDIFDSFIQYINNGDELAIDITHSFRSLPVLFTIMIQYLRLAKEVKTIWLRYGAFETLKLEYKMKKNEKEAKIKEENLAAPVFDLTPFVSLFEWTQAIGSFVQNGNPAPMAKLARSGISPLLKECRGTDEELKNMKNLCDRIETFSDAILACRGKVLMEEMNFDDINSALDSLNAKTVRPLLPMIDRMKETFAGYRNQSLINGFIAAEWCLKHGMLQQAATLLDEFVTETVQRRIIQDIQNIDRETVSRALSKICKLLQGKKFPDNTETLKNIFNTEKTDHCSNEEEAQKNAALTLFHIVSDKNFYSRIDQLGCIRNDINHAGLANPENAANPASIKKRLFELIPAIRGAFAKVGFIKE